MEQTDLDACRTPARLAFADHMNRLVTGNCAPSSPEGAEMLTRVDPTLDGPMILFQDVIEVLHRSVLPVLLQNTLVFELHNRPRGSGILVGSAASRRRLGCSPEPSGEKAPRSRPDRLGRA